MDTERAKKHTGALASRALGLWSLRDDGDDDSINPRSVAGSMVVESSLRVGCVSGLWQTVFAWRVCEWL